MLTLKQAARGGPLLPLQLVEDLIVVAITAAREAARAQTPATLRPRKRSLTLRPGPETPCWNELVRQVRPHLRKYGAKSQLARLLGLPRQRLQDCLKTGSASLDAERTLLLLGWLGFFQRGGELSPAVRPGRKPRNSVRPVPGNV
jgi:hypothetical protein